MRKTPFNYKYLAGFVLTLLMMGGLLFNWKNRSAGVARGEILRSSIEYKYTPEQKKVIEKMMVSDLEKTKDQSEQARSAMNYFRQALSSNKQSQKLFFETYKMFGAKPETFSAARYMALYPILSGAAEFSYMMKWTYTDLQTNSDAIMNSLEENQNRLLEYTAFQIGALNMTHQLNVDVSRKAKFYSANISRPIEVNNNGDLEDSSYGFELALIMAKQDKVTGQMLVPAIRDLIEKNKEKTKAMSALKVRVINYYPELVNIFVN